MNTRQMTIRSTWFGAASLAVVLVLPGCDLSVSNPGPVQDDFLDDPGAHPAVVAGIRLNYSLALNMVAFFGSEAAKEYTQAGRIHPIKLPVEPGQLDVDVLPGNAWNEAHQARWVAEDGVRRLREAAGDAFDSYAPAAEALLFAGYANRMLGENMCEAVIDESEPQPHTVHLERAEGYFSEAIDVGTSAGAADVVTAAHAGRASVLLLLGNHSEALADAGEVPPDFVYQAEFDASPTQFNNWIHYISSNQPYRAHSVVDTYFEGYYEDTGDPRVRWDTDPDEPNGEFQSVPWLFQLKYPEPTSPVNLSSGREMVLIEAEIALRNDDPDGALALLNGLREGIVSDHDGTPIPEWEGGTNEEVWTALKRERGIELWLESRRLADLRRWTEEGTPGEMEDVSDRIRLCFPIANSERRTNPNISLDHQDPVNPEYDPAAVES